MIIKKWILNQCIIIGIITLLIGCNNNKKSHSDLQKAFEFHQEAIKIRQITDKDMSLLNGNKDSSFIKTYKRDLDSISILLNSWDEVLIEVPGFDEDHDHSGHDHDHDHDKLPELTAEQHLEVQQHLLKEIRRIAEKVNNIKDRT